MFLRAQELTCCLLLLLCALLFPGQEVVDEH